MRRGRPVPRANLVDFLGGDEAHARAVLDWRDDQVPAIEQAVTAARRRSGPGGGTDLPAEQIALLAGLGLLGADGRFTPLGHKACYNSSEFQWQSGYDPLEGLVAAPTLTPQTRLLDLGGGSGQTLRRLFPKLDGTVVCLDIDLEILAYGVKTYSAYGLDALFCRASASRLPLRDGSFDFLLCRTALNYMHQKRALTEAFRVLRPGGWLFVRFENIHYDLRVLTHSAGLLNFLFHVRSLAWGVLHAVTGYQPTPGGKLRGPLRVRLAPAVPQDRRGPRRRDRPLRAKPPGPAIPGPGHAGHRAVRSQAAGTDWRRYFVEFRNPELRSPSGGCDRARGRKASAQGPMPP